jgi:hypothetical protein
MSERTIKMLRAAGFHLEADRLARVTPEEETAFDLWLEDPGNKARWEKALAESAPSGTQDD